MNIDGPYKNESAGLGGILRDDQGSPIATIGQFPTASSALHVELLATLYALQWCRANNHKNIIIESDSEVMREQNKAADWLAKEALAYKSDFFWTPPHIHKKLHALIHLELKGIPYLRN
ncbi:hypothetical protein LIER_30379 [Lithospermum erythrorhizon]|uniref:RNase H type-1 domain-containing protein n=1 Tax=Lithospermum erythrorhizon TaxID=34254 RepID=A0AAV3RR10_LITER